MFNSTLPFTRFHFSNINALLLITLILLTTSCSTDIQQYQNSQPSFSIKRYFNGNVQAWGMVQDYSNKVTRRFCVDIVGTWQTNANNLASGELAETFYFDDGEVSTRNWQLTEEKAGVYTGSAHDVIGTASGSHQGFAFHWQYYLQVPVGDTSYEFWLDDWMYQLDQRRVFNRTEMKKFGVTVAEITLFFDNQPSASTCRLNN